MVSLTLLMESDLQVTACLLGLPLKGWLSANEMEPRTFSPSYGTSFKKERPTLRPKAISSRDDFLFLWQKDLQKQLKDGRVYSDSQFEGVVHCGKEIMLAEASGSWPYCIHDQKAEREEC